MKIPIELKPYPDEILSSWLIRNSVACGSDPSSWVGGIWLEFRAWTRDIDRHLPLNEIRSLSKITSLSQNQIKNMTLEPLIIKIYTNDLLNPRKAWPFVIPTGSRGGRKINGTYFCKDCLQEPNFYLKKQWRLAWNVACAKHKQILIHRCPKCNEAFAPHLITYENTSLYQCSFCGYDLRLCTSTNANQEVLHFQEELNQIIFSKKFNSVFPVFEQTVQELFSTIRVLLSFCRYLIYSNKYQSFLNKIGMKDVIAISGHSSSATFEAMAAKDRQKLLLIISKISFLTGITILPPIFN